MTVTYKAHETVTAIARSNMQTYFHLLLPLLIQQLWPVTGQAACNNTVFPGRRYVVNLDLLPEERWREVVGDNREAISTLASFARKITPPDLYNWAVSPGFDVRNVLPYPYGEEIVGIARAAGVSASCLFLVNLMYELDGYNKRSTTTAAACTTVVAQAENGLIYTARTLDSLYEHNVKYTDTYKKLSITVDFQRFGKTVYTGSTWAGYVGLQTGQRPNEFTVALNAKDTPGKWQTNIIEITMTNAHALIFTLIRDTLASALDFASAVHKLSTHPVSAPCYFIVGGIWPGEAVVITRARNQVQDLWWIGGRRWFLVQVNSDHWKTDEDPAGAVRKNAVIKRMNRIGPKNLSYSVLLESVLCTPPVMRNITLQVIVMLASTPDHYQQWGRYTGLQPMPSTAYMCTFYNQNLPL